MRPAIDLTTHFRTGMAIRGTPVTKFIGNLAGNEHGIKSMQFQQQRIEPIYLFCGREVFEQVVAIGSAHPTQCLPLLMRASGQQRDYTWWRGVLLPEGIMG